MRNKLGVCGCLVIALGVSAARADSGIDWSDNPSDWPQIKEAQGKVSKGDIDFDDDPDYGVQSFSGPLTSKGAGPVSPGVVLDNVVIDTVQPYISNLNAFGTGTWRNPSNAVNANYFSDSLEITLTEPNHTMVMLNHWGFPGDLFVDVSFYDKNDTLIDIVRGIPSPEEGHAVLYWTKEQTESIGRIVIHDPEDGAEGIMQSEYWIPEPGSLLLLAIGGAAVFRRRR